MTELLSHNPAAQSAADKEPDPRHGEALYGLLAEFDRDDRLVAGTKKVRELGYARIDAFSPFPLHGLAEAIGRKRSRLPLLVLVAGMAGMCLGFGMQWFSAVVHYPLNIGGRPYFSWPAFIPITFEMTVLFAALTAVVGMLGLNGLPQPYHPVFNVNAFERASRDGFFLVVEARDAQFDLARTRSDLEAAGAVAVYDVPQ